MAYGRNLTDELISTGGYDIPLAQGSHGRYRAPGQVVGFKLLTNSKPLTSKVKSKPRHWRGFFLPFFGKNPVMQICRLFFGQTSPSPSAACKY